MRTYYYSLRRTILAAVLFGVGAAALVAQEKDTKDSAAKPSSTLHEVATDSHEGVTIGVDPWTQESRYKEKFPKNSPFSKGVVAIHVRFRNDTDHGLKVNLESVRLLVQLSEESRQELVSLSPDDVADTVALKGNAKDPTARRSPLPIPLPTSGVKSPRDSKWTAMRDACANAGVPTSILAAHSTVEGLMYFDLRGELDLLQNAHLYVPSIVSMGDNQPLSYFDIALQHDSNN
jgi:hypothetical protein